MGQQNLQRLSSAAAGRVHHVQHHVRHDAPVQVEGNLAKEDEYQSQDNVRVAEKDTRGEEDGGNEDAHTTDDWVSPWVDCPQLG